MSSEPRDVAERVQGARTDEAFDVVDSAKNPRLAPRVIPVIVAILVGLALIAVLFVLPR